MNRQNKKKMKIACLGNYFSTGGAQMDVVLWAELFRQQGYESESWFFARTGNLDTGNTPYRIFADKKSKNPFVLLKMLLNYVKACREFKPDAIISFYPFSNVVGALTNLCGLTDTFVATQRNPSNTQSPFFYHIEKILGCTKAYDTNICITQSVADSFASYPTSYKNKIKIVYNGLPPLVSTNDTKEKCRKYFGFPENTPVIGMLGRLHKQKNVGFIVRCMKNLPNHFLGIAGSGPEYKDLQILVENLEIGEQVKFVGELSGEDITKFYKGIDIFAMPSIYEGFGRTLVEALILETPVVCSDLPVLKEVSDGTAITLPLKEKAWIDMFEKINDGQIDLELMTKKGKKRAESFTLDIMIKGYLDAVGINS